MAVHADVAQEADIPRLFEQVDAASGPLTALVNNASMLEGQKRVDELDMARRDADEVARSILWLLSDEAAYVTGGR